MRLPWILFGIYLFSLTTLQRRFDKIAEQRLRAIRSRGELRVELRSDEPRVVVEFNDFHETSVRGRAGEHEACLHHRVPVLVVELVTVTMTLVHQRVAVGRRRF